MSYLETVLKPRMSEKAYGVSQLRNTYVFDISGDTNKQSVAHAVSIQYEVTVTAVRIVNVKGKVKRTVRKGGRPTMGRQSDTKKAYVTLKSGDTLPIFAAIEEAEAKDAEVAEKLEKATAKAEAKEAKELKKDVKAPKAGLKNPLSRAKKSEKEAK
jgi:large subunit ribosomal protein L23